MRAPSPTAQLAAGHLPSNLVPDGADPRTVVIVQQAPRSYTGPVVLVLVAALGSGFVIYMLLMLVQVTATAATTVAAAAPAVGGISLSLKLARKVAK
jgi:hypothetical protein